MKKLNKLTLLWMVLALPWFVTAQSKKSWSKDVTVIESKSNETISVESDLSKGVVIEDLSWAWNSSNACFPATQMGKFNGNHVFFATVIPPRSIMKIKITPEDENSNLSLYAYSIGTTDFSVVPDLHRSVTCEADHKWDRPWKGKTQDHTRTVELNAIPNPYNVVIGVTSPKGVTSGKFKLEISVKS